MSNATATSAFCVLYRRRSFDVEGVGALSIPEVKVDQPPSGLSRDHMKLPPRVVGFLLKPAVGVGIILLRNEFLFAIRPDDLRRFIPVETDATHSVEVEPLSVTDKLSHHFAPSLGFPRFLKTRRMGLVKVAQALDHVLTRG
jgi:hypothetical protein